MIDQHNGLSTATLCVALIHNHQSDRNAYLVPELENLSRGLAAPLVKIGWQPALQPHGFAMRLWRDWRYFQLQRAWARYRLSEFATQLTIVRAFVSQTLDRNFHPAKRSRMSRISQIETLVTAKHIAAWHGFLESDASHLLCCEDDLVIKADSLERLRHLLSGPDLGAGLRFIDLAGGLPVSALGIERLVSHRIDGRTFYRRATTNTACCYLLSRPLAEHFMAVLIRDPDLRLVGIDWMMNALLMNMLADGISCDGLHFDPPIFGHGTFTGDYVSWMQLALDSNTQNAGIDTI